jgi:hypothetical protein
MCRGRVKEAAVPLGGLMCAATNCALFGFWPTIYSGNRVVETTVTDSSGTVISTQTYAYSDSAATEERTAAPAPAGGATSTANDQGSFRAACCCWKLCFGWANPSGGPARRMLVENGYPARPGRDTTALAELMAVDQVRPFRKEPGRESVYCQACGEHSWSAGVL